MATKTAIKKRRIDLGRVDWLMVLADAALKTEKTQEQKLGTGALGPRMRDFLREFRGDEVGDADDEDGEDDEDDDNEESDASSSENAGAESELRARIAELQADNARLKESLALRDERGALTIRALEIEVAGLKRAAELDARERELLLAELNGRRVAGAGQPPRAESKPATPANPLLAPSAPPVREETLCEAESREAALEEESPQATPDVGSGDTRQPSEVASDAGDADDDTEASSGSEPEVGSAGDDEPSTDGEASSATVLELKRPPVEEVELVDGAPEDAEVIAIDATSRVVPVALLEKDPLRAARMALEGGDLETAKTLFTMLEEKAEALGADGEEGLVAVRCGLAETHLRKEDLQGALLASKRARKTASAAFARTPTPASLLGFLTSSRVRATILVATQDPVGALTLVAKTFERTEASRISRSPAHTNELNVLMSLAEELQRAGHKFKTKKAKRARGGRRRR
ncbi:MAG: hypothetical protein R3A79_18760 [Nannocystaceae bacterium]